MKLFTKAQKMSFKRKKIFQAQKSLSNGKMSFDQKEMFWTQKRLLSTQKMFQTQKRCFERKKSLFDVTNVLNANKVLIILKFFIPRKLNILVLRCPFIIPLFIHVSFLKCVHKSWELLLHCCWIIKCIW